MISIDIIRNRVRLLSIAEFDPGRLKSHDMGRSIKTELICVFVKFIHMVLGFCHEFQNFELTPDVSLVFLGREIVGGELTTHLLDLWVLVGPLFRQIFHCIVHAYLIMVFIIGQECIKWDCNHSKFSDRFYKETKKINPERKFQSIFYAKRLLFTPLKAYLKMRLYLQLEESDSDI